MGDLFDYLAWRGDLTLAQAPLNEIDGMILSRFAYVPFEHMAQPLGEDFVPIRLLAERALADEGLRQEQRWKLRDEELVRAMGESERFGSLPAGRFVACLDETTQTQFAALTVQLGPEHAFVVFRGTDNTVVGWKEDLNMSFQCPIPGQIMAADYLTAAGRALPGLLEAGGHSKGGNLAAYAAAFCDPEVQEMLGAVYNYDGPGFYDRILETEGYQRMEGRLRTFLPQFSVVGMLLGHRSVTTVVHSTEKGLAQHDMYSWEVLGPRFPALDDVTGGSRFLDSTIKDWIQDMTPEQFEQFADTIYTVLTDTQMQTMHEMKENWFDTAKSFVHTIVDMDEMTRDAALEALKLLARSAGREAREAIGV